MVQGFPEHSLDKAEISFKPFLRQVSIYDLTTAQLFAVFDDANCPETFIFVFTPRRARSLIYTKVRINQRIRPQIHKKQDKAQRWFPAEIRQKNVLQANVHYKNL